MEQSLLQIYQTSSSVRLSRLQDDDRSTWLVVGGIEPISVIEEAIAVRLIEGIVVEVIDGYRDVVFGIQEGRVDVVAFKEVLLANCASLDMGSAQLIQLLDLGTIGKSKLTLTFLSSALSGNAANAELTSPNSAKKALRLTILQSSK